MEGSFETRVNSKRNIRTWLFNPFHYVAGGKALIVGVVLILGAGFIGALSNSHFDGVLDFHTGATAPVWVFVVEGLINWIAMSSFLFFGGKIVSKSHVRVIDVFGTQALARSPGLVTMLFALLPGYRRFAGHLAAQYIKTLPSVQTNQGDIIIFVITVLIAILMLVWMVALMYRAHSVSCNVVGGKAIGVFILGLILGEAVSKVIIIAIMSAITV